MKSLRTCYRRKAAYRGTVPPVFTTDGADSIRGGHPLLRSTLPLFGVMTDVATNADPIISSQRQAGDPCCCCCLLVSLYLPFLEIVSEHRDSVPAFIMIFRAAAVRFGIHRMVVAQQSRMASTSSKALTSGGGKGTLLPSGLLNKWYNM